MMAQCNKWGNSPLLKLETGEYHKGKFTFTKIRKRGVSQCNKRGNSPLLKLENGEYHKGKFTFTKIRKRGVSQLIKGEIHLY